MRILFIEPRTGFERLDFIQSLRFCQARAKFLASPESQAKWHIGTGYFAINPAAYEEDIVKKEWEKYPQFKVTVDQLQDTKPSFATQGALISVFLESRQQVVTAL